MKPAPSRAITSLPLVAVAICLAVLAGCSSARGVLLSGGPRTARAPETRRPLELMGNPAVSPRRDRSAPLGGVEAAGAPQPSPDGKWIAFESDQDGVHGVWLARPEGEQPRRISGSRVAVQPRWSPDGSLVMFLAREPKRAAGWNIWIADPDMTAPRQVTSGGLAPSAGASWFPDSRHICYGSGSWLMVADTETSAIRSFRLPNASARVVGVPAVSPDGRHVAFAVDGEGAWMVSVADGSITQIVDERDVDAFAWAPGGREIAFRTGRDGQWKVRVVK